MIVVYFLITVKCLSDTSERCDGRKVVDTIYFDESYVTNLIKVQTLHILYKLKNAQQTVRKRNVSLNLIRVFELLA